MRNFLLSTIVVLMSFPTFAQTENDTQAIIEDLNNKIDSLESVIWDLRYELRKQEAEKLTVNGIRLPYGSKVYETPIPYEDKTSSKFKVFQALSGYALANEKSGSFASDMYYGKVVLLLGTYYDDQIVKIKSPMVKGMYTYSTRKEIEKTVPIIVPGK